MSLSLRNPRRKTPEELRDLLLFFIIQINREDINYLIFCKVYEISDLAVVVGSNNVNYFRRFGEFRDECFRSTGEKWRR